MTVELELAQVVAGGALCVAGGILLAVVLRAAWRAVDCIDSITLVPYDGATVRISDPTPAASGEKREAT